MCKPNPCSRPAVAETELHRCGFPASPADRRVRAICDAPSVSMLDGVGARSCAMRYKCVADWLSDTITGRVHRKPQRNALKLLIPFRNSLRATSIPRADLNGNHGLGNRSESVRGQAQYPRRACAPVHFAPWRLPQAARPARRRSIQTGQFLADAVVQILADPSLFPDDGVKHFLFQALRALRSCTMPE